MHTNPTISQKTTLGARVKQVRKRTIVYVLSLMLVATGGYYEANAPDIVEIDFQEPVHGQVFQSKGTAAKKNLLLFYTDYCYPCESLTTLFGQVSWAGQLINKAFIPYKIDAFDKYSGKSLMERYQVKDFPTIVITDEKGIELNRIVGISDEKYLFEHLSTYSDEWSENDFVQVKSTDQDTAPKPASVSRIESPSAVAPKYSLVLESYESYSKARGEALLRAELWENDLWIESTEPGQYQLLLGTFTNTQDADLARNYLKSWEGLASQVETLEEAPQSYQ